MTILGPWTLGRTISDVNYKKIVEVSTSCLCSMFVPASWVLKIRDNADLEELTDILNLIRDPPRNMVEVPKDTYHQFGLTPNTVWFAMRNYEGHLTSRHADLWVTVATACIQFMCDLHTNHRKVYMDFRMENVLVSGKTVAVADYELVTSVNPKKTKDADRNNRWYYLARGAEMNEWLCSWRHDFVSLGYLLVTLTAGRLPFVQDFMDRREGFRPNHKSVKDLLKSRNAAIRGAANPTLRSYFDKIEEVKWDSQEPPAPSFYKDLEGLFTTG